MIISYVRTNYSNNKRLCSVVNSTRVSNETYEDFKTKKQKV